jgi:hypothetical protein
VTSRRLVATALLVLVLTVAGCTDGSEPSPVVESSATSSVGGTTTTAGVSTTTTTTATTATTSPAVQEIRITVAGSTVTGGGRHKVNRGATVRIVVTADVTDEVHLHGYDKKANVTPTAAATIELVVNIPGVFEVELEKRAKQLAQLEVTG